MSILGMGIISKAMGKPSPSAPRLAHRTPAGKAVLAQVDVVLLEGCRLQHRRGLCGNICRNLTPGPFSHSRLTSHSWLYKRAAS